MKNEFFYPSKDGMTQIHAIEWIPEGDVAGAAFHVGLNFYAKGI